MDLRFVNLKKEYAGRRVLDIEEGSITGDECIAVIGPNGAGKSTLVNLIAGLDISSAGQVYYEDAKEGTSTTVVPYMDLTLVFQKPYLISTTVERNILYPLKLRKWDKDQMHHRATELIKELGLTGFEQQKAWKLSGGETQKVALARALSFRPRLLLLDEPTANVDPTTTGEIENMLKKISAEEGIKIIIVTHNLAQAKRLCSQAIFMHEGKIIEQGPCEQILMRPGSELTRKFVSGELLT